MSPASSYSQWTDTVPPSAANLAHHQNSRTVLELDSIQTLFKLVSLNTKASSLRSDEVVSNGPERSPWLE